MELSSENDGFGSLLDNVRLIADQSSSITLAENSANGTVVARAGTSDVDTVSRDTITYSLTNNSGGAFTINATTGVITVANTTLLDFETTPTRTIVVRAADTAGATLDRTFTIGLTNVNEAPTAVVDSAIAVEAGGVANGTAGTNPTGNVLTNDTDVDASDTKTVTGVAAGVVGSASTNVGSTVSGTYGSINIASGGAYTYTVNNSNATVQALRTSGQTLTDVFSYTMRDAAGLTSTTQITVTIQGANDTPSDITGALTIAENSSSGAVVGTLATTDVDAGETFTYALTNNAGGRFSINTSTGQVTVANGSLLDFETNTSHTIVVQSTDAAGASFSKTMTVTVTNVNEAPTALTLTGSTTGAASTAVYNATYDKYYAYVSTALTWEAAMDNAQASYLGGVSGTLVNIGSAAENSYLLTLNSGSNWIGASDKLQDGIWRWYNGDVAGTQFWGGSTAASGGVATGSAYANWVSTEPNGGSNEMYAQNYASGAWNDNLPSQTLGSYVQWSGAAYRAAQGVAGSVMENATAGTVIGNLAATDADAGETYTYSLIGGAVSKFQLSGTQLQVKAGATFDYESTPTESLTVRVTDSGGLTRDLTVTINVVNVNEAPIQTGVIGNTNLVSNSSFETDTSGWNLTGNALRITGEGATVGSYSLVFSAGNLANDGVATTTITTVVGQTYTLTFDMGAYGLSWGANELQMMNVQVVGSATLVNETLTDSGTNPNTFNAYRYTFTADSTSTTLRFADASTVTNSIDIAVDNIQLVAVTTSNPTMTIAENSSNGTVIGQVASIDPDAYSNMTYSLQDNAGGRFAINARTGQVTVANGSLLNFEAATSHSIVVRTTDQGGLTFDKTMTINVSNVNEAPVAVANTATAIEAGGVANATPGTNPTGNVLTNDTDVDAGDTKTVIGVVSGTQASASGNVGSSVSGSFGSINIAADGSYTYTVNNNNATVQAMRTSGQSLTEVFTYTMADAGGLTSTTQITVTIQGANDAPSDIVATRYLSTMTPTATNNLYGSVLNDIDHTTNPLILDGVSYARGLGMHAPLSGAATADYAIGGATTFKATIGINDYTTGTFGSVIFRVYVDNVLQYTSATLSSISSPIDVSINTTGGTTLRLEVDNAGNGNTADHSVWFNARLEGGSPTLAVAENSANGTVVGSVNRIDSDWGDNATYTLTNNAGGRFSIDSSTGLITVTNSSLLNFESSSSHTITVQATDASGATFSKDMTVTLNDVNEAPTIAVNTGRTVLEGSTSNVISNTMLNEGDPDDSGTGITYTVTSAVTRGTLRLNGVALAVNSTFTQADIDAGLLTYDHDNSENFTDAFGFSMADGGENGTVPVTGTFNITVTPVNDNAPIITSNGGGTTAAISLNETLVAVTTVTATDADLPGQTLTYSIAGGSDGARFAIDATGKLTFIVAPDYEAPSDSNGDNVYFVTVQVSDGTLIDTQTITVTVLDVSSSVVVTTTADQDDSGLGSAYTIEQLNAVNGGSDGKISLREAIIAANNSAGIDTISFGIANTDTNFTGTAGVDGRWVIQLATALPTITEGIVLDATTQTTFASNSNAGTIGGGAAGVDGLTLGTVGRPEIVLVGTSSIAQGFDVNANNTTIRGFGINGFTTGAAISLRDNITGTLIENNAIGVSATTGSDPGVSLRNATGISSAGADSGTVRNNVIGYTSQTGLLMSSASNNWTIQGNTFRDGGINFSNGDAIAINGSSAVLIQGNFITGTSTQAIILSGSTTNVTIDNNTLTQNGIGPTGAATIQSDAIAIRSGVSNVTIIENVIADNYGAGITVNNGASGVRISQNSMYGNGTITSRNGSAATGQIGIDLQSTGQDVNLGTSPYYTLNDAGDTDSGGNSLQNFPVLTMANSTGSSLAVAGNFNSLANRTYTIEFFSNPSGAANSYTQGRTYLGSITVTTDGSGNATFSQTLAVSVASTDFITATATDNTTNETSEFGLQFQVNVIPIAVSDSNTAIEAGGTSNATPGSDATGNLLSNDTDADAGDTKSVIGVVAGTAASASGSVGSAVAGAYGSITVAANGTYTYVVDNNNSAVQALRTSANTLTEVFTYTMTDSAGATSTTQVTITIQGANDAPTAVGDSITATEAGGLNNGTAGSNPTGNVLSNDVDVDSAANGETKAVIGVAAGSQASASGSLSTNVAGSYGWINIAADGSYTYTVDNNNSTVQALRNSANTLSDVFTYTMTDAAGSTSTTQITVTVRGANDAPVAAADSALAVEAGGVANASAGSNPSGNVLTNDVDVDSGDTKTVTGVVSGVQISASGSVGQSVAGAYGSITIAAGGAYTYNVDNSNTAVQALRTSGQTLTDVFTYTMVDTDGVASTTQITITIQGANDAPVANSDTPIAVEAGGVANATSGTNPTGNLLANDTDVDAGDTKTVVGVIAGTAASATGAVGNTIAGVYGSIVVASDGTYTYTVDNSNTAVQALRTASDTLQDVFTYTIQDTAGASATATVTITIQGRNDNPVAVGNTATAVEAGGVSNNISGSNPSGNVLTNDTDVDAGDTKTVTGVAAGVQGSTSGSVGSAVNGAYGSITINANGTYTYTLNNNNATVEALNASSSPLTETFSYTVTDTAGASSTTTIVITIQGADDLPFAIVDMDTAVEAGGINNATPGTNPSGNVLANDIAPNGVSIVGVTTGVASSSSGSVGVTVNGLYGSVVIHSDGSYTYTIDNNNAAVQALRVSSDHLTDIFTYTMRDSLNYESSTQLTITLDGTNDAPTALNDTGVAIEAGGLNNGTAGSNATGNVLSNDVDVDAGDTKSVIGVASGSLSSASGSVGASVTGTYGSLVLQNNGSYIYTVNNSNAAVQALRSASDTLTEVFTYSMEDTAGATSTAYVTITIQGRNDTPASVSDSAIAVEAGGVANGSAGTNPSGNVLTNDTDVDSGDTKTVIGLALGTVGSASGNLSTPLAGSYGSLTLQSDGTYTYVVDNNNSAVQALRTASDTLQEVFTYTMQDSAGAVSTTQITITIQGSNDTPVLVSDTAHATEAGGLNNGTAGVNPTGNVLSNDSDVDGGDTRQVSGVAAGIVASASGSVGGAVAGSYGSINIASDGSYSYTINQNSAAVQALRSYTDTLTETFTYTVQDTAGATSTTQIVITIHGQNDSPLAVADTAFADEAGGVNNATPGSNPSGNVLSNDLDADATVNGETRTVIGVAAGTQSSASGSVAAAVGGTYGSISIDSTGAYTYQVDNNNAAVQALRTASQTLTDVFTYTMQDTDGVSSTTQITITIRGANDTPYDLTAGPLSVNENSANNTSIGIVTPSDRDAGESFTYSLTDTAGGRFTIDSLTGEIRVADGTLLNYEANTNHTVTVRVTDTTGSWYEKAFVIAINDLDEFDVSTPTDTDPTANAVNENVAIGTTVGITANAFDLDATTNTITYSLTSNPGGLFQIDANTGVVTTAASIDRETVGGTRSITVQALSSDGSTSTQTFNITINDIDEFDVTTPTDTNNAVNQVDENVAIGTTVGITANAFDLDATTNTITYSLTSNLAASSRSMPTQVW